MKKTYEREPVGNPLEAAHEISRMVFALEPFIKSMQILGMSGSDEMAYIADEIKYLADDCAKGICKESSERLKDSQQATANMIGVALAVTQMSREEV